MKDPLLRLKKRYRGEWIAMSPPKAAGGNMKKLLAHHPDKKALHQMLREKRVKDAYITFAGTVVKPGYAIMFHAL